MIRFQALGTRFVLPLPALLMPLLAMRLGLRGSVLPVFLALSIHEAAHAAAAILFGVQIAEIRLAPFGGSARIENPYGLSPARIIPVAAAGPLANLCSVILLSAAAQWNWIDAGRAILYLRPHITLMLFNLIPAMPLDGGRILFAVLSVMIGEDSALQIGLWIGRTLCSALIGLFVYGGIVGGKWNLTLIFAAIFLITSERDERDAHIHARAARLSEAGTDPEEARPARIYQVNARMTVQRAIRLLRPREAAWFVVSASGKQDRIIGAAAILRFLAEGGSPDARLADVV